jgi:hypothetical protein
MQIGLGQDRNPKGETVLTCIGVQCAIFYRKLERCLKMLQNSIAGFQERNLSFVRFDMSVPVWSASA